MKRGEILQELQAVIAGAEVPVEDGEIDRTVIGDLEGGFRVGRGENFAIEVRLREPFAHRLANGSFVIDDENGVLHGDIILTTSVGQASTSVPGRAWDAGAINSHSRRWSRSPA